MSRPAGPDDGDGRLDMDRYAAEVRVPGTLLASVQHANHELGTLQQVGEAARLDPASLAAKFDLEVVLRALSPKGTRPGSNPSTGGKGAGRRGAGAGLSGSGF